VKAGAPPGARLRQTARDRDVIAARLREHRAGEIFNNQWFAAELTIFSSLTELKNEMQQVFICRRLDTLRSAFIAEC
jgi:hypothetical protein